MLVPVVVASKHGATTGLGEAVARTLLARGIVAPVSEAETPPSLDDADAVIVGKRRLHGRSLEPARTFLHQHALGPGERTLVRVVHVPEGDFRDWDGVSEWAEQIADSLLGESASAGG